MYNKFIVSKWYEYKGQAINLRRKGKSIREIENKLKIPRSTLSGWFRNIKLSDEQIFRLNIRARKSLIQARKKAVIWHNRQKEMRLLLAKSQAESVLDNIDVENRHIMELALAMLYLGEGSKFGLKSWIFLFQIFLSTRINDLLSQRPTLLIRVYVLLNVAELTY